MGAIRRGWLPATGVRAFCVCACLRICGTAFGGMAVSEIHGRAAPRAVACTPQLSTYTRRAPAQAVLLC